MRSALIAVVALGCSSNASEPPKPPPIEAAVGGFGVHVESDPLRIVIAGVDGRVLFDGLPPADVAPQSDESDPPPLTGLAVRDVDTTVQAMFGAYQFTDVGNWRVAKRATNLKTTDGVSFDAASDDGVIATVAISGDGKGQLTLTVTPVENHGATTRTWASVAASCTDDDRFQGFGAQQRDVEFHGQTVPIFISEPGIGKRDDDANVPIWYLTGTRHASSFSAPIYVARRGYVAALDTPGRASFAMCADENRLRIAGDVDASNHAFTLRFFDGPTPKEALQRSAAFFGKPRLPPRLAFAPWNDAIFGTANVEAFAKFLRDNDIPSSAIWTEDFRGGAFFGDDYKLAEEWDVDRTLYPDFEGMISRLHQRGFAWFSYFNTFVEQDLNIWKESQPKGVLTKHADGSDYLFTNAKMKPSSMLDLTNPAARQFMIDKLRAILAMGSDGWMGDYGEWFPVDAKTSDGSDPWAAHGLYPKAWQEVQRAALDADDLPTAPPKSRRLAFVRSGGLRSGPLADVVWGGDQATDMSDDDGLPTVIPMGLGLGVAGISTYGHDVAGYQTALRQPTDKETFFRWVEVGAFTPVMRTHHGTQPKKEWMLQSDADSTAHFRRYAILHQQLLPVWESLAKEASDTGIPIWRSLALEAPEDAAGWGVGDEFMIGPNVLVAPVVKKGATSRTVHLPAGNWIPWSGGAAVSGDVTADAPLGEVPVYVREGTVLSLLPDTVRSVIEEATGVVRVTDIGDDRTVLVFGHGSGSFVEASGTLKYSVNPASGAATWNGAALPSCTAGPPPCADDANKVHVVGPGMYVGKSTVEIEGGVATRSVTIELR